MTLVEKINKLPSSAVKEVNDFVDFLIEKHDNEEKKALLKVSEKSLDKIWHNSEDDIYGVV